MYDNPKYWGIADACTFLGLGRSTVLKLCQKRTHGFPAVKVGNRYQIDEAKLRVWREDWFAGKFDL